MPASRIVFVLVALLAAACATPPAGSGPAPQSWAADEARIRAAMVGSAEAWNRADLKGHLAIYVDSVGYMTRTGPRPGVAAIESDFNRVFWVGGKPKQNLRFEQMRVSPLGRDAALGTGRFILSGGGESEKSGWFTLVWLRTAEGWKAVHDHSS